ncbi:MAG: tyrosine-type recombinase/integrase, partial [Chloroflexota bacterium]|nr:tyrosine-type recombinase/integrase [Chloroflexota bacterium]
MNRRRPSSQLHSMPTTASRSASSLSMRHTHATLGLEAGIPPKVMQERLGHSSITMTLDLYS